MKSHWWIGALFAMLVCGTITFVIRSSRSSANVCKFDGAPINTAYRVRIETTQGKSIQLCSIKCAELWLTHQSLANIRGIHVTDEATKREISAFQAVYVRSRVVINPITGERRHAFENAEMARQHAEQFAGRILSASEKPFGGRQSRE